MVLDVDDDIVERLDEVVAIEEFVGLCEDWVIA